MRFVIPEDTIPQAAAQIHEAFPTPKVISLGKRSIWTVRQDGNARSDPRYNILRMNMVFDRTNLAEIQLMHPDQVQIETETRQSYESRKTNYDLSIKPEPLPEWITPIERIKKAWNPERNAFVFVNDDGYEGMTCPFPTAYNSLSATLEPKEVFEQRPFNAGKDYHGYIAALASLNLSLLNLLANLPE